MYVYMCLWTNMYIYIIGTCFSVNANAAIVIFEYQSNTWSVDTYASWVGGSVIARFARWACLNARSLDWKRVLHFNNVISVISRCDFTKHKTLQYRNLYYRRKKLCLILISMIRASQWITIVSLNIDRKINSICFFNTLESPEGKSEMRENKVIHHSDKNARADRLKNCFSWRIDVSCFICK